jgi:hypothetical protein
MSQYIRVLHYNKALKILRSYGCRFARKTPPIDHKDIEGDRIPTEEGLKLLKGSMIDFRKAAKHEKFLINGLTHGQIEKLIEASREMRLKFNPEKTR